MLLLATMVLLQATKLLLATMVLLQATMLLLATTVLLLLVTIMMLLVAADSNAKILTSSIIKYWFRLLTELFLDFYFPLCNAIKILLLACHTTGLSITQAHWGRCGWCTVVLLFYDICLWPHLIYLMVSCEDRSPSLLPPSSIPNANWTPISIK